MVQGKHNDEKDSIALPAIVLAVLVLAAIVLIGGALCSSDEPSKHGTEQHQNQDSKQKDAIDPGNDKAKDANKDKSKKDGKEKTQSKPSSHAKEKASDKKPASKPAQEKTARKETARASKDLSAYTICIDAGHSAHPDSTPSPNSPYASESKNIPTEPGGTDGPKSGNEYEVCLDVALMMEDYLKDTGVHIVQVRTTNDVIISPKERAEIANECDADMFVRLHCDSAGKGAEGFYTLVPAKTGYQADDGLFKTSQEMGKRMHAFIVKELGAKDRGITVRKDQGGFNWCMQPAVLFEMANLANAADDERMASKAYREKMAKAISDACIDYLESLA